MQVCTYEYDFGHSQHEEIPDKGKILALTTLGIAVWRAELCDAVQTAIAQFSNVKT